MAFTRFLATSKHQARKTGCLSLLKTKWEIRSAYKLSSRLRVFVSAPSDSRQSLKPMLVSSPRCQTCFKLEGNAFSAFPESKTRKNGVTNPCVLSLSEEH